MWDKSIITWDELIAETPLNLEKVFKRAYRKNISIVVFDSAKKKRPNKAAKAKTTEADAKLESQYKFEAPIMPESQNKVGASAKSELKSDPEEKLFSDSSETKAETSPVIAEAKSDAPSDISKSETTSPLHDQAQIPVDEASSSSPPPDSSAGGSACCGLFAAKKNEDSDEESAPLIDPKDKEKADDEKEASQMVSTIKGLFGLGEDDPPDSSWLNMTIKDFKNNTPIPMGKLCISCQIMPKAEAKMNDNGFGRNDPNHSPLLPPPTGRLTFSWNPFVMGTPILLTLFKCFYLTTNEYL